MKFYFTFFILLIIFQTKGQSIFNVELINKIDNSLITEKINVLILIKPTTEINFSEFADITFHYQAATIYSITGPIKSIIEFNIIELSFGLSELLINQFLNPLKSS